MHTTERTTTTTRYITDTSPEVSSYSAATLITGVAIAILGALAIAGGAITFSAPFVIVGVCFLIGGLIVIATAFKGGNASTILTVNDDDGYRPPYSPPPTQPVIYTTYPNIANYDPTPGYNFRPSNFGVASIPMTPNYDPTVHRGRSHEEPAFARASTSLPPRSKSVSPTKFARQVPDLRGTAATSSLRGQTSDGVRKGNPLRNRGGG